MKKLLLLVFALMPVISFAQGFQVNLEGEKQIGMGHTGTGLVQDGASVFFNPGAVAMLPQNYVQGGISPLLFKSTFNPQGTNVEDHTANKIATPFTFYAAWGPKDSFWKLGLGVYTPFGGLADWGDNWQGKYVLESLNLKAIYIQPTLSIKLADFLSVGGGFVYNRGSVDLTQAIPLTNSAGQDGQAELKGTGKGYGWNAGIYIVTEAGITVGITHRSEVNTTINNGTALFTVPSSLSAQFPQPNTFSSSIPLPATTSIGFGFYPTKQWTLALDVNMIGWDVYKVLAFNYGTVEPAGLQNTVEQRDYQDAFSFRGGAQYKTNKNLAIRFGGGYATTAVEDGFVSPEAPDANRAFVTGGLGYTFANHLDLDVSFEYEHVMSRDQTNIQTQLAGTFETNVYIPGISLAYHW
ncbi:OmpP1/FadL family transporter [Mucilaginibacter sp. E4BP6]|jgi:long-chain fatty acid transport protein|uniref:OmpP1/FadL family transporter n=1 Tax=Mucilaginibacter sp. E4BP6 TaxID=2723089 RepID=UPI0015C9F468|nr:outer membrane protein transport protein [Mucilaginibacter sp. E4BP6]NYE65559.1 long-chain fatty acid transport protein [Mucilaginibacter sp. E4BP6]